MNERKQNRFRRLESASFDFQVRNCDILRMRRAGTGRREVAREFGVTPSRIDQIVRRLTAAEERAGRIDSLGERMRSADDLNAQWPMADVLDALRLATATRKALAGELEACESGWISLRQLMRVASADAPHPWPDRWPRLLAVRHIGGKGYLSILEGIGSLQLGENCRREWERTLAKLKASPPFEDPDRQT